MVSTACLFSVIMSSLNHVDDHVDVDIDVEVDVDVDVDVEVDLNLTNSLLVKEVHASTHA